MAVKVRRSMKARKSSKLHCGHYVTVGARIVQVSGFWVCLGCALNGWPASVESLAS